MMYHLRDTQVRQSHAIHMVAELQEFYAKHYDEQIDGDFIRDYMQEMYELNEELDEFCKNYEIGAENGREKIREVARVRRAKKTDQDN